MPKRKDGITWQAETARFMDQLDAQIATLERLLRKAKEEER